jgi:hypothetical protein
VHLFTMTLSSPRMDYSDISSCFEECLRTPKKISGGRLVVYTLRTNDSTDILFLDYLTTLSVGGIYSVYGWMDEW